MPGLVLLALSLSTFLLFALVLAARGAKRRTAVRAARTDGRESQRRFLAENWASVERIASETMAPDEIADVRRRVFELDA